MIRLFSLASLIAIGLSFSTTDASACHRSRGVACYVSHCWYPCWEPCWPHHHHHHHPCFCIAYRDPYLMKGMLWVRCDHCPHHMHHHMHPDHMHHHLPAWHFCYVYLTGKYEWVKVIKCYPHGVPHDKDAEAAEGYKKAAADMGGEGSVVVNVPAGAKLTIDGVAMGESAETTRRFQTQTMEMGYKATYTLVAEYANGDRRTVVKREVTVGPQQEVTVDLTREVAADLTKGEEGEAAVSAGK